LADGSAVPPAFTARCTVASTVSRLSADRHRSTSEPAFASAIGRGVNWLNFSCVNSMTWMLSLKVMHAAVSSVNRGSFTAPSASRKPRARARSVTGRLTKIIRDMVVFSCWRLDSLAFCAA
jgi:hypothetical protein